MTYTTSLFNLRDKTLQIFDERATADARPGLVLDMSRVPVPTTANVRTPELTRLSMAAMGRDHVARGGGDDVGEK